MPLSVGFKLGPYEILARIGAGGMGEVWKARDTRLGRIVAVKISKAEFSERFEREAKAIAALNNSNICQIYDVGQDYLVMEYVEGTPLKGPLPLDQVLKYAVQICDALDAAHKKGITHRDLKPANILVTKTCIKLLDFGLAKLGSVGIGQVATSPADATRTMALTVKNEIVGTLHYMSPEQLQAQANGEEIDARSDIFSFGLVLYEMLTGKRAFEGSSPASVIAAIMERPAPSVAEIAPPALDRVLQICLAKDPDERWQTARDLKRELAWIASGSSEAIAPTARSSRGLEAGLRFGRLPWIVAAVLTIGVVASSWIAYRSTRPVAQSLRPLVRLDVDLGPDVFLGSPFGGADAILSPDGTRLVYVSHGKLFTRRLDQLDHPEDTELPGTERAYAPFFSPDGQWVAFFAPGKLKKISVEGGAAIALCDALSARGGSWGEDGNIIAALDLTGVLSRIPSAGGAPTPVTELAQGEATHRWPQILPGGKAVLFTASATTGMFDGATIEVMSLEGRRRRTLQRGGTFGRYLPSGHLIYVNKGTLFAVPFDPDTLAVRGKSVPVLEEVGYSPIIGSARLDFSRNGALLYRSGGAAGGLVTVQWLDAAGRTQPLLTKPGFYRRPRLSPDGQRLALQATEGSNRDIWIYEWHRDTMMRLTFGGGSNDYPVWSPDGRYIVFQGEGGMFWTRADGAGKPQPLTQSKNLQFPSSFTPDGKRMAFVETKPGKGAGFIANSFSEYNLWTVPLESDGAGLRAGKPEILPYTPSAAVLASFSPDGRWLAYVSNESGTFQVYVRAVPDNGGKWQISTTGGVDPVWSRSGRELFFLTEDTQVMVAGYTVQGDSIVVDKPRMWSGNRLANLGGIANFDLALDGKRIAALMPVETTEAQQGQTHVIFLLNFADELQRKVPAGR
jgi:serine/threonine-protein kinase